MIAEGLSNGYNNDSHATRQKKNRDREHWRVGDEIEQIGIISQDVVDLLAEVIKEVRS